MNKNIAKWRKLNDATFCKNEFESGSILFWISITNLKVPKTNPVNKDARAPFPFTRFQKIPNKNIAAIGGEIYACTLCK